MSPNKRVFWGAFDNVVSAAAIASKLRRHGMYAVVEGDEVVR